MSGSSDLFYTCPTAGAGEHRADIHLAFCSLAAPSSPCVSSANHVQLARTVRLDRRARPLLY
jgi:hypothetical protein